MHLVNRDMMEDRVVLIFASTIVLNDWILSVVGNLNLTL